MRKNNNKIDFVIAWVDGNDIEWQKEKNKYSAQKIDLSNSEVRYRDWEQLKYWFRGIEKYAPWVHKIYFITCGQKPEWLNEKNEKLVLVNHKDYIPEKFLPTFSANPIELNFHRINGLSNNFVYFNDDMFIINPVKETDFFIGDLPCDDYCEAALRMYGVEDTFPYMLVNNSQLINKYFNKRNVMKKNKIKYFNLKYGIRNNLKNIALLPYNNYSGFAVTHLPASFNKTIYEEVWSKETELLEKVSSNKFRTKEDVNQYIFKYWQYCKGQFYPRKSNIGLSFTASDNNENITKAITGNKYRMICINDNDEINNLEKAKQEINNAFEKKFYEKSSFEK